MGGISIDDFCAVRNVEVKKQIVEKIRIMGPGIKMGKGRTHYGIATCVCQIADEIINQRPTICSVSSVIYKIGEHGCRGVLLNVLSVMGSTTHTGEMGF